MDLKSSNWGGQPSFSMKKGSNKSSAFGGDFFFGPEKFKLDSQNGPKKFKLAAVLSKQGGKKGSLVVFSARLWYHFVFFLVFFLELF